MDGLDNWDLSKGQLNTHFVKDVTPWYYVFWLSGALHFGITQTSNNRIGICSYYLLNNNKCFTIYIYPPKLQCLGYIESQINFILGHIQPPTLFIGRKCLQLIYIYIWKMKSMIKLIVTYTLPTMTIKISNADTFDADISPN